MSANAIAAEEREDKQRQALIVLGMHRSGTSAVSGVFARLGAQPPKSLMPPTPDNPRGYWESSELMKFHDSILQSAGSDWSDWESFNAGWIDSPAGQDFRERLAALLEAEYGDARLILVKDPRMCRFFALWEKALATLGFASRIVIPVRHPFEVVGSLKQRDGLPGYHAKLLWLRHILDAEHDSRNATRLFVRYSDMLMDWQSQAKRISDLLGIKWPRFSGSTMAEIEAYLAPELRHHTAQDASPSALSAGTIDGWVNAAFLALERLVDDPAQSDALAALNAIRQQFNETAAIYAPIVQERRMAHEALGLEYASLRRENDELKRKYELLDSENRQNQQRFVQAEGLRAQLEEQLGGKQAIIDELESRREALEAGYRKQIESQAAQIESQKAQIESQAAQIEHALRTTRALQQSAIEERARQDARYADASRTIRVLESELEEQRRLIVEYRSSLDRIRGSRYWRAAEALRRLTGVRQEPAGSDADGISDEELVDRSALFDRQWYLGRYPDVGAQGIDPVAHYLAYGAREGRDPSGAFSTSGYLARYPDVASHNPLIHYLRYGRGEGRVISASQAGDSPGCDSVAGS